MVDWDNLAPMIVAVTLILTSGGVLILRPLSKRAAELLEAMAKERTNPPQRAVRADDGRVIELLETMSSRLERLEERQDFTDSLLESKRENASLPPTSR